MKENRIQKREMKSQRRAIDKGLKLEATATEQEAYIDARREKVLEEAAKKGAEAATSTKLGATGTVFEQFKAGGKKALTAYKKWQKENPSAPYDPMAGFNMGAGGNTETYNPNAGLGGKDGKQRQT